MKERVAGKRVTSVEYRVASDRCRVSRDRIQTQFSLAFVSFLSYSLRLFAF
jgi:hypothetical protein